MGGRTGAGTEGQSALGRSGDGGAGCWGGKAPLECGPPEGLPLAYSGGEAARLVFEQQKRSVSHLPTLYIYNFPLSEGSRTLWKPSRLERAVVKLGCCAFPVDGAA